MKISEMQKKAYAIATEKGFYKKQREFGVWIALIHSELSEALEADRKGDSRGVAEELADVVIRVMGLCSILEIDLETAIKRKMKINNSRPYLHEKRYG